jgi:hypothetical protein
VLAVAKECSPLDNGLFLQSVVPVKLHRLPAVPHFQTATLVGDWQANHKGAELRHGPRRVDVGLEVPFGSLIYLRCAISHLS